MREGDLGRRNASGITQRWKSTKCNYYCMICIENIIIESTSAVIKKVYHGGDITNTPFFYVSSEKSFAKDYGNVVEGMIKVKNMFDPFNYNDLKKLFQRVGVLRNRYEEDEVYTSPKKFLNSDILASDNWDVLESYLKDIMVMGFDSVLITEGGIINYILFDPQEQFILLSK